MSSIYKKGRDGYYYYQTYVYNPESKKKDKRVFHALRTKDSVEAKSKQHELDMQYEDKSYIDSNSVKPSINFNSYYSIKEKWEMNKEKWELFIYFYSYNIFF